MCSECRSKVKFNLFMAEDNHDTHGRAVERKDLEESLQPSCLCLAEMWRPLHLGEGETFNLY